MNLKSLNEYDLLAIQLDAENLGKNYVAALKEQARRQEVELK